MSSIDGLSPFSGSLSPAAVRGLREPKKTRAASGLRAQVEDEARLATPMLREEPDKGLDHSGTEDAVPFRNGQAGECLNPLFVAQLLGQLLPNPERSQSSGAVSAYKDIARRLKLYDRIL